MQIHIKWASATGKTKVTELPLKLVRAYSDDMLLWHAGACVHACRQCC